MKTFVTFSGLARRTGLPAGTLFNRIRELKIQPDGITVTIEGPPIQLFDTERIPELRRQLLNPHPILT